MNVVITGTSRGIGLELCRQALAKGGRVLAVARDPDGSQGLQELKSRHPGLDLLAIDHAWLTSIVVHPGWVQTDMGGQGATLPAPESAAAIWRVIDELKKEQSGRFLGYRGTELPW